MAKSNSKFTWVQTHKELAQYLSKMEGKQKELIELLKGAGVKRLIDEKSEGNRTDLEEIDPFTFFCFINKYGNKRRLAILQKLAEKLNLHYPKDVYGIPSAQAQKVMMFRFKHARGENDIENLWDLFFSALDDSITDDQFKQVLSQYGVGEVKITETLYYIDPDKYFPINGPSKPYLKEELGIDPSFNSYTEYLNILDQIKEVSDKPFYEISHDARIWIDQQNNKESDINYWVFQGNPKIYNLKKALQDNALTTWRVNAHKSEITPGDKVILWASGDQRGCYALAEVDSEIYEDAVNEDETPYYSEPVDDEPYDQVQLQVIHNLASHPITEDQIKSEEKLSNLNGGNQGTNFAATREEYETLIKMAELKLKDKKYWLYSPGSQAEMWDEFYDAGMMALGWDELGDLKQYNSKEEIVEKLQDIFDTDSSKKNDATANWDFYKEISKGDVIIAKRGRSEYLGYGIVTSDYFYDEDRAEFKKCRKVDWKKKGVWEDPRGDIVVKTLTDITPYEDYVARIKKLIGFDDSEEPVKKVNYPLNTIFYGPPGTGKTYHTVKRAAEIVEQREIESYVEAQEIFNEKRGDTIEFITFHQNYSYEDFIQGLRPDTEHNKELTFERVDGIFKQLADRALKNLKDSRNPQTKKKSFEKVFNEFVNPLVQGEVEELEVKMKKVSFYITAVNEKSIEFRKISGGTDHTLNINTLKKMYESESAEIIQGLKSYYTPLMNLLLEKGKSPGKKEVVERKNYVIIIDEINRANISRVFGELITLIEPDKRSEGEFALSTKLPSGEEFTVPSNLYIIGTMNTADKSIALLDIALRRRFDFEAMYPMYEIGGETIHDVDVLRKINERIIKLKGHDFQIGHSYFMNSDLSLVQRMNRKVIPLLLEYFMNDEKEVTEILKNAGLQIQEDCWPLQITVRVD